MPKCIKSKGNKIKMKNSLFLCVKGRWHGLGMICVTCGGYEMIEIMFQGLDGLHTNEENKDRLCG